MTEDEGFDYRQGQKNFLFSVTSRRALGPIQPHMQWVSEVLSPEVKRQEREADISRPSNAEVRMVEL
jgi:hypothetical protein